MHNIVAAMFLTLGLGLSNCLAESIVGYGVIEHRKWGYFAVDPTSQKGQYIGPINVGGSAMGLPATESLPTSNPFIPAVSRVLLGNFFLKEFNLANLLPERGDGQVSCAPSRGTNVFWIARIQYNRSTIWGVSPSSKDGWELTKRWSITYPVRASFDVDADAGLAYVISKADGNCYAVGLDGNQKKLPVLIEQPQFLALSPNRKLLAVSKGVRGVRGSVAIYELGSESAREVLKHDFYVGDSISSIVWSPGSKELAFIERIPYSGLFHARERLVSLNVVSGKKRTLYRDIAAIELYAWLPDGFLSGFLHDTERW